MPLRGLLLPLLAAAAFAVAAPLAAAGGSHGSHADHSAPAQSHDHSAPAQWEARERSHAHGPVAAAGTGPDRRTRLLVIGGFVAANAWILTLAAFARLRRAWRVA